jgi:hypothetical protein
MPNLLNSGRCRIAKMTEVDFTVCAPPVTEPAETAFRRRGRKIHTEEGMSLLKYMLLK